MRETRARFYIILLCKGFSPRRAGRGQATIARVIGERGCTACDGGRSEEGPAGTRLAPSGLARIRRTAGSPQPGTGFSLSRCLSPGCGRAGALKTARPRSGLSLLCRLGTQRPDRRSRAQAARWADAEAACLRAAQAGKAAEACPAETRPTSMDRKAGESTTTRLRASRPAGASR